MGDDAARPVGFYQIDNSLLREYGAVIGVYGVAVYNVLAMYANGSGDGIYPAYQTIADQLGISRRKVIDTIDQLCQLGLVRKEARTGKSGKTTSNGYVLPNHRGARHAPQETTGDIGVHDMHCRGAQDAPSGVHDMHHASAQHAPDQDPIEQYPDDQDPVEGETAREEPPTPEPDPPAPRATRHRRPKPGPIWDPRKVGDDGYVEAGAGTSPVEVYYEFVRPKDWILSKSVREQLVDEVTDLDRWRWTMRQCALRGFRSNNILDRLKCYHHGFRDGVTFENPDSQNRDSQYGQQQAPMTNVERNLQAVENVFARIEQEGIEVWQ